MIPPFPGKIVPRYHFLVCTLFGFVIVTLGQAALAQHMTGSFYGFPSQPSNAWPVASPQPYAPFPANYPLAQWPAQPSSGWQLVAPGMHGARTWPVNYNYYFDDDQPAGRNPPSTPPPPSTPRPPATPNQARPNRPSPSREIGGPFISTQTLCYWNDDLGIDGKAQLPVLGRMNCAEHNSPLPRDRAYGIYKHYNSLLKNSVSDFSGNQLGQSTRSVEQYLFGYEKTFHDGLSSLELRMPFTRTGSTQFSSNFSSNDPSIGNLGLFAKRLLYADGLNAVAAGCGVTVPTGDDTLFNVGSQSFSILNNSAHILPFLGLYKQTASQQSFVMAFAGLDIPTRGNDIQFVDPVAGSQDLGKLVDQTLLYLDVSVGHWLYRNPCCDTVTGFAVQGELHYAGTLNDATSVTGVASGVGWNTGYDIGSTQNRFDNIFAAVVLHAELRNQTDLRVAGIFPLNDANHRFFDSELVVSLVQRF